MYEVIRTEKSKFYRSRDSNFKWYVFYRSEKPKKTNFKECEFTKSGNSNFKRLEFYRSRKNLEKSTFTGHPLFRSVKQKIEFPISKISKALHFIKKENT